MPLAGRRRRRRGRRTRVMPRGCQKDADDRAGLSRSPRSHSPVKILQATVHGRPALRFHPPTRRTRRSLPGRNDHQANGHADDLACPLVAADGAQPQPKVVRLIRKARTATPKTPRTAPPLTTTLAASPALACTRMAHWLSTGALTAAGRRMASASIATARYGWPCSTTAPSCASPLTVASSIAFRCREGEDSLRAWRRRSPHALLHQHGNQGDRRSRRSAALFSGGHCRRRARRRMALTASDHSARRLRL